MTGAARLVMEVAFRRNVVGKRQENNGFKAIARGDVNKAESVRRAIVRMKIAERKSRK